MNLQSAIAEQEQQADQRKRRAGRARSMNEANNVTPMPITPSRWFDVKFGLSELYGDALLEEMDKNDLTRVVGINEDYLAATLSEQGCPHAPTVFLPEEQRFYTWSPEEGIYIQQREPVLIGAISKLLLACARACNGSGVETQALEFRLRDTSKLIGVMRKAKGLLEVRSDFFNSDLDKFIACANGMLDLSDYTLKAFSPSDRRRNKLAVPFDPSATCPIFRDKLMRPALKDDDLELVQRWCGLALTGLNLAQKIVLLIGRAGTGKGCFIRVLRGIIGQENLASLRPQLLGERFELGRFLGKSLLYGPDVPENFLNQRGASVLKSLTGGDPFSCELKNSNDSPQMMGHFNVIATCNSRLTVRLEGDTDAWRRRLVIIDYHKDGPKNVIADLDQQILKSEASGVLNWMLEGLAKLRADGWQLKLTTAQQAAVDNLLLESDALALFVKDEIVRAEDGQLTINEVFGAYADYCTSRGWITLTRNRFGGTIADVVIRYHGKTVRHDICDPVSSKATRGWSGITLQTKTGRVTETLTFDDPERQRAWDNWEQA
jgi:putative DNA primase/helicase